MIKQEKKLDPNNLFDFINILFTKWDVYESLSDNIKQKHSFIFNRFMSIQYPVQSAYFSYNKFNSVVMCDFWYRTFRNSFESQNKRPQVPGWIYTKTKSIREETKKRQEISDDTIEYYKTYKNLDYKSYLDLEKLFPNELYDELLILQKRLIERDKKYKVVRK